MPFEDAKRITNLYLYDQETTPTDLTDASLLRLADSGSVPSTRNKFIVNRQEFMQSGGGRFAIGSQFELVNRFFDAANNPLPARDYTKIELRMILGLSRVDWPMQQYDYQDDKDDYAERIYIYNTMSFQITDDAIFIVSQNGERRIENFGVEPRLDVNENFDFTSRNPIAVLGNSYYLEPRIDPCGIGRTVPITFSGEVERDTYNMSAYIADLDRVSTWSQGIDLIKLPADIITLTNELWASGVIRFLDSQDRPILYGTSGDDALTESAIQEKLSTNPYFAPYQHNGIVVITGAGNDLLTGGPKDDRLLGGEGANNYHIDGDTTGRDVVVDGGNGAGRLYFGAAELSGLATPVANRPARTAYTLQSGDMTYLLTRKDAATGVVSSTGTDLEIKRTTDSGTNTVTVKDFEDGQFGIRLDADRTSTVQPECSFIHVGERQSEEICTVTGGIRADVANITKPDATIFMDLKGGVNYAELKSSGNVVCNYQGENTFVVKTDRLSIDEDGMVQTAIGNYRVLPGYSPFYEDYTPATRPNIFLCRKGTGGNNLYVLEPRSDGQYAYIGGSFSNFLDGTSRIDVAAFGIRKMNELSISPVAPDSPDTLVSYYGEQGAFSFLLQGVSPSQVKQEHFIFGKQANHYAPQMPQTLVGDSTHTVLTSGAGETTMVPGPVPTIFKIGASEGAEAYIEGKRAGDKIDLSAFNHHIRSFGSLDITAIRAKEVDGAQLIAEQHFSLPEHQNVYVHNALPLGPDDFIGNANREHAPHDNRLSDPAVAGISVAGTAALVALALGFGYKHSTLVRKTVNAIGSGFQKIAGWLGAEQEQQEPTQESMAQSRIEIWQNHGSRISIPGPVSARNVARSIGEKPKGVPKAVGPSVQTADIEMGKVASSSQHKKRPVVGTQTAQLTAKPARAANNNDLSSFEDAINSRARVASSSAGRGGK